MISTCSTCRKTYERNEKRRSRQCRECINATYRAWEQSSPARQNYKRQLLKINPTYNANQQASSKRWQKEIREKRLTDESLHKKLAISERNHDLKDLYGMTLKQYEAMLEAQNFVCAICMCSETVKSLRGKPIMLSVDHCHATDVVRGLLCMKCNHGIGLFYESAVLLENAARYLETQIKIESLFGVKLADARKWFRHRLHKTYNLSWEEYVWLKQNQNNLCAICKKPEVMKSRGKVVELSIDHEG